MATLKEQLDLLLEGLGGDIIRYPHLPVTEQQSLQKCSEAVLLCIRQEYPSSDQLIQIFPMIDQIALRRSLPPPINPIGDEFDPEEDEPIQSPGWPILLNIYGVLMRILEEPPQCRRLVNIDFVVRLLTILDSEDNREREAVKTLLHRIYGAFLTLRAPMRKSMQAVLLEAIHCRAPHKLSELLEIFGSIVNGFAVPLRTEHVSVFLKRCLLPLHCLRTLPSFFPQLAYCVVQFAEKDPQLTPVIIEHILKHWPHSNSITEVLLLGELEELLEHCSDHNCFRQLLFHRLAISLQSSHFQVAERSLMLCSNERILSDLMTEVENLRIMVMSLEETRRHHWNKNVQIMSLAALSSISQADPVLFEECLRRGINGSNTTKRTLSVVGINIPNEQDDSSKKDKIIN